MFAMYHFWDWAFETQGIDGKQTPRELFLCIQNQSLIIKHE